VNLFKSWGWEIIPHPPYSSDLTSSDFHQFPDMEKYLRGQRFHSNEDVQNEVKKCLPARTLSFFSIKDFTNEYIAMISA
jgi:histone-lysine N-methyltransferase SETMAR